MSIALFENRKSVFAKCFLLTCLSLAASTASASAQEFFNGWGPSHQYDSGWHPSVAQHGSTVVEVHNGSGTAGRMWWKVGQVQSNHTIVWPQSGPYDYGWNPNVALDSRYGTTVVEVHNGSGTAGKMWYNVGQVQSNGIIAWNHSWPYDYGWNPRVAFCGLNVMEVHNRAGTAGPMWYHWGSFTSSTTINFGNSVQYDWGYNPSAAVCSLSPVEVHNGGGVAGPERYHVGTIQLIQ